MKFGQIGILNHAQVTWSWRQCVVVITAKMEDLIGVYSVFFDLAYQTAWRRYNHRKFWNVIVHVGTAWLSTRPLVSIGAILFPLFVNIFLIFAHIVFCLIQDAKLGAVYSVLYILVAYHGLTVETTFARAFTILVLVIGFQIAVGHFFIESEQPVLGRERPGDAIFIVCGIMNDLLLAPFHFSVLALMRANLLPDLQWKSDIQLKKLMEQLSGKKSP